MYLKSIDIKHYRLLVDIKINVDESATLIVGRNNSGKTSLMDMMINVLEGKRLVFDDYPIFCREKLYRDILMFVLKKQKYEEMLQHICLPSMKFTIDYALDDESQDLGALAPFIIDTDIDVTEALIIAEYRLNLSEEVINEWFEDKVEEITKKNNKNKEKDYINVVKEIVIKHFGDMFKLVIEAINPMNMNDKQIKSLGELKQLFPLYKIRAERGMDESDIRNNSPLSPILSDLFKEDIKNSTPDIEKSVNGLKALVELSNRNVQGKVNSLLNEIVGKSLRFGYPNAEELQLHAVTQIALDEQIKSNTDLAYIENETLEILPSTYNGLGYKNLIKIEFELAQFAKMVQKNAAVSIPILFLEEPESHMHPQLQQTFIKYLSGFLKEISEKSIQVFITTHSSHIVNTVQFKQVRYVQKRKNVVIYKDLSDFCKEFEENAKFVQKYLTINRCDLFFADKAVLIEGAAERLLIPDMIAKCRDKKLFKGVNPDLSSQYCALIEVGGAYAHKFCPFMDFLGIPTLLITDIDSVTASLGKVVVSKGVTSSNATIKWWVRREYNKKEKSKVPLDKIRNLPEDMKTNGLCHIEYQTDEKGLCGRSLEEAIKNANRKLYNLGTNPSEDDLEFVEDKKTDFALDLLLVKEKYNVPEYIKSGLIWLNKQRCFQE